MRILMLVEELNIGGLPNLVLELARALAEAGDTVVVAHLDPQVPDHLDVAHVALMSLQASHDRRSAAAAMDRIRAWRPDVVHIHLCSDLDLLTALSASRWPVLRSFHDYTSLCLRRGKRRWPGDRCHRALGTACLAFGCSVGAALPGHRGLRLESLNRKQAECQHYRDFDAAVVGSRHMQDTLLINGFAPDRVHWVPYFSRFDGQAQGRVGLAPKAAGVAGRDRPLQWLFAGQAVTGKGLGVLIESLQGLTGSWQLTAVSSGPQLPKAKALARSLGLENRIRFIDWLPQAALADLYRHSDVFIVPSVWDDPGPLVGLEAMSMETPVVAFPVGGLPDYVHNGETGWLTDEVSVGSLRRALQKTVDHATELPRMGLAARQWVAARHGRSGHVVLMQALYRTLVAPRRLPMPLDPQEVLA